MAFSEAREKRASVVTCLGPQILQHSYVKKDKKRKEKASEAPQQCVCVCAHIVLLCVQTGVNLETT